MTGPSTPRRCRTDPSTTHGVLRAAGRAWAGVLDLGPARIVHPGTGALSPAAGAAVMSTAVLSVALSTDGHELLSRMLLALAVAAELCLGAVFVGGLLLSRAGWLAQAGTPPSLTAVAATTVLGSRFALLGWSTAAWLLLAVSTLVWLVLLPLVLRHWQTPTAGSGFLVCVATQGLAVLAGALGRPAHDQRVVIAGVALLVLGIALYGAVLATFDWRQLRTGAGDQWVLAGALAITSLAAATLAPATRGATGLRDLSDVLGTAAVAFWFLALTGYTALVAGELVWPRWSYDVRRWATVFPIGMAAAASSAVGRTQHLTAARLAGDVLVWPGLAAWALTLTSAIRSQRHRHPVRL